MKQTKISYWLKGMAVVLGIMGILGFGGLTWYAFSMKADDPAVSLWQFIFFSWCTAILCYVVLYQFWKICSQIGRENSFSMENARSFHKMALCGIAEIVIIAARMIWLCVINAIQPKIVIMIIVKVLLAAMFVLLCEALSRLVQYAYDVKRENDLTI